MAAALHPKASNEMLIFLQKTSRMFYLAISQQVFGQQRSAPKKVAG